MEITATEKLGAPCRPTRLHHRRGQAVLEFIFSSILIFVFLYAIADFALLHVSEQRASYLVREAAFLGWLECGQLAADDGGSCLSAAGAEALEANDSMLKSLESSGAFILSLYKKDNDGNLQRISTHGTSGSFPTKFDTTSFPDVETSGLKGFVTVELYYDYEPLTPIFKMLNKLEEFNHIYISGVS